MDLQIDILPNGIKYPNSTVKAHRDSNSNNNDHIVENTVNGY